MSHRGKNRLRRTHRAHRTSAALGVSVLSLVMGSSAHAFDINTGNPDVTLRWDNTVKYSTMYRLKDQDPAVQTGNSDDGDWNFDQGFVSQRVDLLSEFDFKYRNYGFRVSGAGWYDALYNRHNDNGDHCATINHTSTACNEFSDATRELHGGKYEILDAFAFGSGTIGDRQVSGRIGRYAMIWGESIFFGSNGLAGGMAPIDIGKLTSVPNSQAKEVTRPVGQGSVQVALTPRLTFGAYYQFEWKASRFNASGAYLSTADVLGDGAELFRVGVLPAPRLASDNARDQGQYGFQLAYDADNFGVGLYAINYHDKTPKLYTHFAGAPSTWYYRLVYPQDIKAYGASFNTQLLSAAVAGEFSVRTNAPLVSDLVAENVGAAGDGHDNPLYAVGRTAHANLSASYSLPRNFLSDGGLVLGEMAWNSVLAIDKNPSRVAPYSAREAVAFRILFVQNFYQVLPYLDISVPIGFSYSPSGRSAAVTAFAVDHGGDVSIGINAEFLSVWRAGLNYTHFYGDPGPALTAGGLTTFQQASRDRDFISLSISRTF